WAISVLRWLVASTPALTRMPRIAVTRTAISTTDPVTAARARFTVILLSRVAHSAISPAVNARMEARDRLRPTAVTEEKTPAQVINRQDRLSTICREISKVSAHKLAYAPRLFGLISVDPIRSCASAEAKNLSQRA